MTVADFTQLRSMDLSIARPKFFSVVFFKLERCLELVLNGARSYADNILFDSIAHALPVITYICLVPASS